MNRKDRRAAAREAWEKSGRKLGDGPVDFEQHAKMTAIMTTLDDFLNDGVKGGQRSTGLVVLTFPFGDTTGRCNFMSNGADRRDIVTLFKEMIARFEGQPDVSGRA